MSDLVPIKSKENALIPALQLQPAKTLEEIYRTMATRPLGTSQERDAFYRDMNQVRGGDKIAHIKRDLEREHSITHFKGFFMGHSGVGKSTEINRLVGMVESKFRILRINALEDLNAADFRPFDLLFVIILRLMEAIKSLNSTDKISPELIDSLRNWFQTKEIIQLSERHEERAESNEFGMPKKISELIGLVFNVSNSLRYTSKRQDKATEYSYRTIGQLMALMNRLFDEANLQIQSEGKEWVVIGEDFDKSGVAPARAEELFIDHANIFTSLRTHLIFNIPNALAYSENSRNLPNIKRYCIFDTPVYTQSHIPDSDGRAALREVMDARVSPELFAAGQQERLIVASGGNLSELFSMTVEAADNAALRSGENGIVETQDVTVAINAKRREYRNALGSSPYDSHPIQYSEKADRLLAIYNQLKGHNFPDRILCNLIMARAIQEFNGESWFGLHPLVVDILKPEGRLDYNDKGNIPGGTI